MYIFSTFLFLCSCHLRNCCHPFVVFAWQHHSILFYSVLPIYSTYANQLRSGHILLDLYLHFSMMIVKNQQASFKPLIIQNHNGVSAPGSAAVFCRAALSFHLSVSKVQNPKKQGHETGWDGMERWHVGGGSSSIIEGANGSRWRRAPPLPH